MSEQYTDAEEMARARGIQGKSFRARLRKNLKAHHSKGSWRVPIGSEKDRLMERELAAMPAQARLLQPEHGAGGGALKQGDRA